MLIQKVLVSQLKPHPDNPRVTLTSDDREYQQIKKSLEINGYILPLVWNKRSGFLVSGHQRLPILIAEGMQEIEVVVVDLEPQQEKNLMIGLNKISGRWDNEKLAAMLGEFIKIPNFDCESIGFTVPEIGQIMDRYGEKKDGDDFDLNAALEDIKEPITKRGDLIHLGAHRVMCGDSSSPDDMKILMGEEKADILDCDFPYNVAYMQKNNHPSIDTRPKKSRKWAQIYSDNMPQPEYEAWMKAVLALVKQYLKPGAAIYVWQGLRQIPPLCQSLIDLDFHMSCIICWLKESAAITYADYCYRTEQCIYGYLNGAPHYWAGKPGESNVWEVKRDPTKSYWHPTQKPVQLAQNALQNSSKIGDIVLDTFLGSGSVLIGAESLGRRCFGMELDPIYVDAVVYRYIAYVGKEKIPQEILDRYCKEAQDGK